MHQNNGHNRKYELLIVILSKSTMSVYLPRIQWGEDQSKRSLKLDRSFKHSIKQTVCIDLNFFLLIIEVPVKPIMFEK